MFNYDTYTYTFILLGCQVDIKPEQVDVQLLLHSLILFLPSGYIQELLSMTCELCEGDAEQSASTAPGSLCSAYDRPNKIEAIKSHKSRFKTVDE